MLVIGTKNNKIREKLLTITDLSLEKAIEIAKASELAETHLNIMNGRSNEVSALKIKQRKKFQ